MKKKSVNFNQKIYNEWNSKELKNFEFQLNEVVTRLNEAEKQQKLLFENSNIENYNKINEGIWDSIKYGLSKLGSLEKGGKIFGGGKQNAAATAQINTLLAQQSNKLVSDMVKKIKEKYPNFPNMNDKNEFADAVGIIAAVYDSIISASKLKPNERGYLDPKAANSIIDTLHKWTDKTGSYELAAIYRRFSEQKDLKLTSILKEIDSDSQGPLRGAGQGLAAYDTAKSNKAVVAWLAAALASFGLANLADSVAQNLKTVVPDPIPSVPKPIPKPAPRVDIGGGEGGGVERPPMKMNFQDLQQMPITPQGDALLAKVTGVPAPPDIASQLPPEWLLKAKLFGINSIDAAGNALDVTGKIVGNVYDSTGALSQSFISKVSVGGEQIANGLAKAGANTIDTAGNAVNSAGKVLGNAYDQSSSWFKSLFAKTAATGGGGGGEFLQQDIIPTNAYSPFNTQYSPTLPEGVMLEAAPKELPDSVKKEIEALKANNMDKKQAAAAIAKIIKRYLMVAGGIATFGAITGISVPALMASGFSSIGGAITGGATAAAGSLGISAAAMATASAILLPLAITMAGAGVATYFIKRNARTNSRLATLQGLANSMTLVSDEEEKKEDDKTDDDKKEDDKTDDDKKDIVNPVPPIDGGDSKSLNLLNKNLNNYVLNVLNTNITVPIKVAEQIKLDEVTIPIDKSLFATIVSIEPNLLGNNIKQGGKLSDNAMKPAELLKFKEFYTQLNLLLNNKEGGLSSLDSTNDKKMKELIKSPSLISLKKYKFAQLKDLITPLSNEKDETVKEADILSIRNFMYNIIMAHMAPGSKQWAGLSRAEKTTQNQVDKEALKEDLQAVLKRGQLRTAFLSILPKAVIVLLQIAKQVKGMVRYLDAKTNTNASQASDTGMASAIGQKLKQTAANVIPFKQSNNDVPAPTDADAPPERRIAAEGLTMINYIKQLIKEQASHYDKVQFKNIKKNDAPAKVAKERLATEIEVDDKKTKFLEAITYFVKEYNHNKLSDEVLSEKLIELGKHVKAKKDVIEVNISNWKKRPTTNAYEVAQLFQDCGSGDYVEKVEDPEKAKKVKEATLPKANVKDTLGASEAAPNKPKGVKMMKAK